MLQRVLHRANSRGFPPYYCDLDMLAENAHYHRYHHSRRQVHCLSHLHSKTQATWRHAVEKPRS